MAITLPQAIFAYQVRKTAQDLGMIGTVAGIAFTYFQTRRPKMALAVGVGMIGYFLYQRWLDEQRTGDMVAKAAAADGSDNPRNDNPRNDRPPSVATPLAQEPSRAMV